MDKLDRDILRNNCSIRTDSKIGGFFNEYDWLSNMYLCNTPLKFTYIRDDRSIKLECCYSTEHIYQIMKLNISELPKDILNKLTLIEPHKLKRILSDLNSSDKKYLDAHIKHGIDLDLYDYKISTNKWNKDRVNVMYQALCSKFIGTDTDKDIIYLQRKLVETYPKYLEETNYWNDTFWGVCNGIGENTLGKLLMDIRNIISNKKTFYNLHDIPKGFNF